uniref:Uncharacterized protein n=1 Tax=uncultured marine virus TaxID=186617 RepID=A0A0F7L2W5_9VIRU|nr:hypothetical protein [uncultured marine virus]
MPCAKSTRPSAQWRSGARPLPNRNARLITKCWARPSASSPRPGSVYVTWTW